MKKAVIILSGGVDSTTLLYDIVNQGYEVYALSFDYGQKHKKELEFAKRTCEKLKVNHKILDLSILNEIAPSSLTRKDWEVPEGHYEDENMKQTVVPNRNMVMLSLATAYAISIKASKVFYGAHIGDHAIYPDCRKEFVDKMKKVIKICDWQKVKLEAPYLNINKSDIVLLGKKLGVDYSLTWSCYKGKEKACGKCGTCVERLEAFKKAGIKDPIEYEK
jgi:7-cyano-7-deazaguanine synthase